jgi:quercetin dioxygenase-like cupin family protein
MKLFRFDREIGRIIPAFDSQNLVMTPIVKEANSVHVGCMYIGPEGCVGFHQATTPQLFLVVQGEGWVTSEDRQRISIKSGQAAYWEAGEWHESGSHAGMTSLVFESPDLKPEAFMTPISIAHEVPSDDM